MNPEENFSRTIFHTTVNLIAMEICLVLVSGFLGLVDFTSTDSFAPAETGPESAHDVSVARIYIEKAKKKQNNKRENTANQRQHRSQIANALFSIFQTQSYRV